MKATIVFLAVFLVVVTAFGEESYSPHRMVTEDGQPDMDKCAVCHNEDLSLMQPRSEVCGMCHSVNHHSGAARHLQADAAAVARVYASREGESKLPLTEDGRMFCGTCHIFHDPAVSGEEVLPAPAIPASTGLAGATRARLEAGLQDIAAKHGATEPGAAFATKGTKALRLPVDDGTLCRRCHGKGK